MKKAWPYLISTAAFAVAAAIFLIIPEARNILTGIAFTLLCVVNVILFLHHYHSE